MKTKEIRQTFIDYFVRNGHEAVASSSLVPGNDATLLFTNAGMVQFKEVFLGHERRNCPRAVTSQRCVRAGGKHNDLENVGYTARHHTFFEMLGNFSFGDYFKQDAIKYAWQLLTEEFGLPKARLWVTVFEEDDEAAEIWIREIGMAPDRVIRIGAKDNFWQMGDTGPCGPCSEIFYDHGPEVEGGPPGTPEQEGDRFVEIWNLVFMQFNRTAEGTLEALPKPSVDTGMGLERMAAVLQGVHSNYETDLFQHLIRAAAGVIGIRQEHHQSLRVIADHIRSTAFLICDGVTPSNEGRGYVLRRIIRRAIRHGYQLGCTDSFLHRLVPSLIDAMGDAFPELIHRRSQVETTLKMENDRFNETLEQGLKILDQEVGLLKGRVIPGDLVFRLYDTFGFPVDLTADVARERGLDIDIDGFESAMAQQRARARAASQFVQNEQMRLANVTEPTRFNGYGPLKQTVRILALIKDAQEQPALTEGEEGIVVLDETPFYAESGGQVGDVGKIIVSGGVFDVSDTQYLANRVIGHYGKVRTSQIAGDQPGTAEVNACRRREAANHHSATHLLHAALKSVLGCHVQQKGSLVEPDRLRFDFSHFEPVSPSQLSAIESQVNAQIRANVEVVVDKMALDEAKAAGAEALFGEKYDAEVRVIRMGDYSFELCGGTHVRRSGDIGLFKICDETGIAAGVRRIEALAGLRAEAYVAQQAQIVHSVASLLNTTPGELNERIAALLKQQKVQQQLIRSLQTKLAVGGSADEDPVRTVRGIQTVVIRQDGAEVRSMRMVVDQWKHKLGSGIVVIVGVSQGKVTVICGVTADLMKRFHAGHLIQSIIGLVNGKGGGKPDLAQGGGTHAEGVSRLESAVYQWVESHPH